MLEIMFSKEVMTVLITVLCTIGVISASAILMERNDRRRDRRPKRRRQE